MITHLFPDFNSFVNVYRRQEDTGRAAHDGASWYGDKLVDAKYHHAAKPVYAFTPTARYAIIISEYRNKPMSTLNKKWRR